jgi:hypothetical protein
MARKFLLKISLHHDPPDQIMLFVLLIYCIRLFYISLHFCFRFRKFYKMALFSMIMIFWQTVDSSPATASSALNLRRVAAWLVLNSMKVERVQFAQLCEQVQSRVYPIAMLIMDYRIFTTCGANWRSLAWQRATQR